MIRFFMVHVVLPFGKKVTGGEVSLSIKVEREREREKEGTRFREISIMPSPPNLSTYHIGLSIVEDCHMVQVMYVGDQQMKKKVDSAVQGLAGLRPCLMHCITNTVHTYPRKHENFLSFSRGLTIKSK